MTNLLISLIDGMILGIVLEVSIDAFVSLLDEEANTNSDKQQSASNDQDNSERVTFVIFYGGLASLLDFAVVTVEAKRITGIV